MLDRMLDRSIGTHPGAFHRCVSFGSVIHPHPGLVAPLRSGGGGQLPTDPTDPQDRKSAEFRNLVDLPGAQAAAQRGGGTCSWLSGLRLGGNAGKYTEQIK